MNRSSGAESIRNQIQDLYDTDPNIDINLSFINPKLYKHEGSIPARILGLYPHIFRVEILENGLPKPYCIQYNDVYIGKASINQLE